MDSVTFFSANTTKPSLNLRLNYTVNLRDNNNLFSIPVFNSSDESVHIQMIKILSEQGELSKSVKCKTELPLVLAKDINPFWIEFLLLLEEVHSNYQKIKVTFYTEHATYDTHIEIYYTGPKQNLGNTWAYFLPNHIYINAHLKNSIQIATRHRDAELSLVVHSKQNSKHIINQIQPKEQTSEYSTFLIQDDQYISVFESYIVREEFKGNYKHNKIVVNSIEPNSGFSDFMFYKGCIFSHSQNKMNVGFQGKCYISNSRNFSTYLKVKTNVDYISFSVDSIILLKEKEEILKFTIHQDVLEKFDFSLHPEIILEEKNQLFIDRIKIPIVFYYPQVVVLSITSRKSVVLNSGLPVDIELEIETIGEGKLFIEAFCEYNKFVFEIEGKNKFNKEIHERQLTLDTSKLMNCMQPVMHILVVSEFGEQKEFHVPIPVTTNLIQCLPDNLVLFRNVPIFLDNKIIYKYFVREDFLPHTLGFEVRLYNFHQKSIGEFDIDHTEIVFNGEEIAKYCPLNLDMIPETTSGDVKFGYGISLNSNYITDIMIHNVCEVQGSIVLTSTPKTIGNTLTTVIPFYISFLIADCVAKLLKDGHQWLLEIENPSENELYVWNLKVFNNYQMEFLKQLYVINPKDKIRLHIKKKKKLQMTKKAPIISFNANQKEFSEIFLDGNKL
ncbi:MAG: hypothetical protein H7A23_16425 [Leptospiraceae bacterium]|nr:hypothetical protein [Leptospiraceae bacterium]MCP5496134.1 hypothetical protein [Leptospiraceae bacterium]